MIEDGWPRWHRTINREKIGGRMRRGCLEIFETRTRIKLPDTWAAENCAYN
jgi:hypothetical protein